MTTNSNDRRLSRLIHICPWIGGAFVIALGIWLYSQNYFQDSSGLQSLIQKAGTAGPLLFVALTAFQVVVPILPGGVSGALGMLMFGTIPGFLYSYIGVLIGSCVLFWLVRKFGRRVIEIFVRPKTYEKYIGWLNKGKKFLVFFAAAIFFPVAPDDVLCMIAGLSDITWKQFLLIIILGKPISMFLYSFCLVRILALL